MRFKILGAAVLLTGLVQSSFGASIYDTCTHPSGILACTFSGSGLITVTDTGLINWRTDATGLAPDLFTMTNGFGVFAGVSGQEHITDLSVVTEPVNTVFPPVVFMSFLTAPTLPSLDINFIFPGTGDNACTGAANTCTPLISPGHPGPFTFANQPGGGTTATFVFKGVTHDGAANWTATFTSQFPGETYSQVLSDLATNHFVVNSYSQGTIVISSVIPEPGSMIMIGTGLLGLAAFVRRRRAK